MLSPEEDVEITSLRKRGWTISAIARHVGHNRKTVRSYVSGERELGVRAKHEPDPFDRFEPHVRQRLIDDQHVWATTLFGEVVALGYDRSYQTFTRHLREREVRPHCEPCSSSKARAHVDIEHSPGEEIQWDWLELEDTPLGRKGRRAPRLLLTFLPRGVASMRSATSRRIAGRRLRSWTSRVSRNVPIHEH